MRSSQTHPNCEAPPGVWPRLALAGAGGLFWLSGWRCRDRAHGSPERAFIGIGAMLFGRVGELLALDSAVVGGRFAVGHDPSLSDLLACREVRHG